MADNDISVERDNNGNIIIGNNNTINAPQHTIPRILTPSLGTHTHFIG